MKATIQKSSLSIHVRIVPATKEDASNGSLFSSTATLRFGTHKVIQSSSGRSEHSAMLFAVGFGLEQLGEVMGELADAAEKLATTPREPFTPTKHEALLSVDALKLDCFRSGEDAPDRDCDCNTCETMREVRAAIKRGPGSV